ncbi:carbon-nitrogen hydrolase family protein [Cryobacterium sp. SO2]|uniref:carbon-nitrogen hydrolase family protein n=1 Tax=Cryobacterium sp. SO2 TaxID=1897060 RepID=UPI00223D5BC0|nr:carbon-nitrogen hydrolase family protein [Cryobacterium sp. SO2]WEO77403.1 carbon-nitrogen hydrolase family protein [Cryobacterium sp. SO2]
MRLTLAQIATGTDKAHNLALIDAAARQARAAGADLVVFPEYAMYEKAVVDASFADAAEPLDGPFVTGLRALATELNIAVAAGVVERSDHDGRPYNTILVVGPDGGTLARYRKVHLFDSAGFRESAWIAPAPSLEPVVFTLAGTRVGLMTCYDLHFPELGRELADAGADLVLACSSWVPGTDKPEQWRVLVQARAIENSYFVAAVSQAPPVSIGRSLLAGPSGRVEGELGDAPALATFDIDPARVTATRARNPALANRRYVVGRPGPASGPAVRPASTA